MQRPSPTGAPLRRRFASPAILAMLGALAGTLVGGAVGRPAHADVTTISVNPLRTGWDPNEPLLTPSTVHGAGFGELFHTVLPDPNSPTVVYAQPVVANAMIIVATEHDRVYGIDENGGAVRWIDQLGTYEPDSHSCDQVTPHLGITSTPVIDLSTNTVYVMARDFDPADPVNGTAWRLHALELSGGGERAGWPVTISGSAHNRPGLAFDPYQHQQRPALLLLHGSVFAGFGSFCDQQPYYGWIAGVSTTTRAQSLYVDEPTGTEGAFWGAGGGFVADGATSFLAASGNGTGGTDQPPQNTSGGSVTAATNLADSVIRYQIQGDGITVNPVDFFGVGITDTTDSDLGSSQVSALPDQLGVAGHPHLGVVGSKRGTLYVVDRDNLGGRHSNDSGVVSELTATDNLFGHVASWPGDGGFVYDAGISHLNAFRLDATGHLSRVANASVGAMSGSPLITSNGTNSGSATLWFYDRGSQQLKAEAANVGAGPNFTQLFSATVGNPGQYTKFIDVAADNNRILVTADDGQLHVFGSSGLPPVPCNCQPPFSGYWMVAGDGGIFPYGNAPGYGSAGKINLRAPIVGMARTPDGGGYWLAAADGGIFPYGDAPGYGSAATLPLRAPIVGIAAVPTGGGYWLVAADGGVFPFGPGAAGYGSAATINLRAPMVGIAAAADGHGYWLAAADGGIFPYGPSGPGYGSAGNLTLTKPVVGIAAVPGGGGYWMVAADGGVFPYGPSAPGYGSAGNLTLTKPMVGMTPTRTGHGYWLAAADGGIFPYGDAPGWGSAANIPLFKPVVGIAAS
jgi:hypothetical protein